MEAQVTEEDQRSEDWSPEEDNNLSRRAGTSGETYFGFTNFIFGPCITIPLY